MLKTLCVYHGNCADGFGAAWVVRKFMKEKYPDRQLDFLPAVYQKTPVPKVDKETEIFIVDFSFGVLETLQLCREAASVTVIDHHKSAFEKLESTEDPRLAKFFDMEHSGAMLAWQFFFGDEIPPPLLRHIEDRDLWKFQLPGTRDIQANLFSHKYDFEFWDVLMAESYSEDGLALMVREGHAIERKHFKDICEFLNVASRWTILGGVRMPVVNVPYMWGSDAAHILAENAENDCAAYYYDTADGRIYGLRSVRDRDVQLIAKVYGGGGHAKAAGFKVSKEQAAQIEADYDNSKQKSS